MISLKRVVLVSLLLAAGGRCPAQKAAPSDYAAIDAKILQLQPSPTITTGAIADYIRTHFDTDAAKVRAAFIWTATNIDYDVENMYALNFYEKKDAKIDRALKTGKGICENYSLVFTDICNKAGIKAYPVEGYTKQKGMVDYVPHLWSAAYVDTAWYLFDPTWGAGVVSNGAFYRRTNNQYFKASPAVLIQSHRPFDCLWQLLPYPVTAKEFADGKTQPNPDRPLFSYADSIRAYERLDTTAQLLASAERITRNGVNNALIFDRLQHLRMKAENQQQQQIVGLYNGAVVDFNEAVASFNRFIDYRNKQFTPLKPDADIQRMVDEAAGKLQESRSKLARVQSPDASITAMVQQLRGQVTEITGRLQEQQLWLESYLKKNKLARKAMFYKVTLMGVPVN